MQRSECLYWVTFSLLIAMATSILAFLLFFILTRFCFKRRRVDADPTVMEDPYSGAPRGVDPTVIETFPVIVYSAAQGKAVCRGMNVCVICLAVFKEAETLRFMPNCGHVFHSGCVDSWLKTHSTCPCCRACLLPRPTGPARFLARICWPAW